MRWILATSAILVIVARATPARADDPNLGFQGGGPAVLEFVFRPRLFDPVRLELGGLVAGGGGGVWNASLGLYVDPLRYTGWEGYVASGAGTAGVCGESETGPSCSVLLFASLRLGAAIGVGHDGENRLTVDVGAWFGQISGDNLDRRTFVWPMGGVGYYW